jgi:hypothetical protein
MSKMIATLVAGLILTNASALYALPRLEAVRVGAQAQGFFRVKGTGTTFLPRGNNYIRLTSYSHAGVTYTYHSLFQPGSYDASAVDLAFAYMQSYGYNVVRVFVDEGHWTRAYGATNGIAGHYDVLGMDAAYLDNVADLIAKAEARGLYVVLSLDLHPVDAKYDGIRNANDCSTMTWPNAYYMCTGYLNAKGQYLIDFATAMQSRLTSSQVNAIMAYQLTNELYFSTAHKPFDSTSFNQSVTTANGFTYNMGVPADRQQAADANMVHWATTVTNALRTVDADAMTTVGFFTYNAVGKPGPNGLLPLGTPGVTDNRFPGRPWSLTTFSNVSFASIQIYPKGASYSLGTDLASIEWSATQGPLMIGEFGALKNAFADTTVAAYAVRDIQVQSCNAFNIRGWLFWAYDVTDPGTYSLMENGGAINGVLAPIVRPNPCVQ